MWRALRPTRRKRSRWFSSAVRPHPKDEGDWSYSPEWWGTEHPVGPAVFRARSEVGNGIVSVVAYPSSRPAASEWPAIERWLQKRYAKIHPENDHHSPFRILGYQWRVLRFNDTTRQSTAKVMAAYRKSDPSTMYLMQQPHCLAVPYLKSMVSTGLVTLASFNYDLFGAAYGKKNMHVLCIGHGGGSLPLFLASKIQGAVVHIVEIDPVVISASVQAMGFPASALKGTSSDGAQPSIPDEVFWGGIRERLFLYKSDAENFISDNTNIYDLIFVDAYDGDDIFPHKLWDPKGPFLKSLESRLHPDHGTVVVNLHADSDIFTPEETDYSQLQSLLPMGKYVAQVCRAYKEQLGMAFTFSVPWLCNISLIACRTGDQKLLLGNKELILNTLISNSNLVEFVLDLPFPCIQYIKRGFMLVD